MWTQQIPEHINEMAAIHTKWTHATGSFIAQGGRNHLCLGIKDWSSIQQKPKKTSDFILSPTMKTPKGNRGIAL